MKRSEMLEKMVKCFEICKDNLKYDTITSLDRVLEVVEEHMIRLETVGENEVTEVGWEQE
jgi:hypothetical protein